MENSSETTKTKLISLFSPKKEEPKAETASSNHSSAEINPPSFMDAMKKNMDNAERLKKERLKANQSVLKSYRIKN